MEQKIEKLKSIWSDIYHVHSYEVDSFHRLNIVNLCHYFQESAWNHAEHLGVGFSDLANTGNIWVLLKLRIQVECLPKWGDYLEFKTWPKGKRSIFALRDFEVFDSKKKCIIKGASEWVIIDVKSRRPQRVDKFLCNIPVLPMKNCFDESINDINSIDIKEDFIKYRVCYSDLDFNGHVNNSQYIRWVLNTYHSGFFIEYLPFIIEVNYRSEAEEAENIEIRRKNIAPNHHIFSIRKEKSSNDLCRVSIKWRKTKS